jgi:hypothetical protein
LPGCHSIFFIWKKFARLGLTKKSIKMQSTPEVDCTFFNVSGTNISLGIALAK